MVGVTVRSAGDLEAAVGTDGEVVGLEGKRYDVDNPIEWTGQRVTLTGSGEANINRRNPDRPLFVFTGHRKLFNLVIENVRFFDRDRGTAPLFTNPGPGPNERTILNVPTIRDVEFRNIGRRGEGNGGVFDWYNVDRGLLERCSFVDCEGDIVRWDRPADPHISRCEFKNSRERQGRDVVMVTHGQSTENGGARIMDTVFMRSDRTIYWDGIFQVGIENTVFDGHKRPPLIKDVGTTKIAGISVAGGGNPDAGFVIDGAGNHKISDSRFQFVRGGPGLRVVNANDVSMTNTQSLNCRIGYEFRGAQSVDVYGCLAKRNRASGLVFRNSNRPCKEVNVNGGTYSNNGLHGIDIDGGTDIADVSGVIAVHNGRGGIRAGPNTKRVRLTNNNVLENRGRGIIWQNPGGRSVRRLNR